MPSAHRNNAGCPATFRPRSSISTCRRAAAQRQVAEGGLWTWRRCWPGCGHLVPLAEAWDSGASAWTSGEREANANDLGDDRALVAVSAASNRSKADQDPSTWLPPAEGYRCVYVTTDFVGVMS
jgi:hypothetical protein